MANFNIFVSDFYGTAGAGENSAVLLRSEEL